MQVKGRLLFLCKSEPKSVLYKNGYEPIINQKIWTKNQKWPKFNSRKDTTQMACDLQLLEANNYYKAYKRMYTDTCKYAMKRNLF